MFEQVPTPEMTKNDALNLLRESTSVDLMQERLTRMVGATYNMYVDKARAHNAGLVGSLGKAEAKSLLQDALSNSPSPTLMYEAIIDSFAAQLALNTYALLTLFDQQAPKT